MPQYNLLYILKKQVARFIARSPRDSPGHSIDQLISTAKLEPERPDQKGRHLSAYHRARRTIDTRVASERDLAHGHLFDVAVEHVRRWPLIGLRRVATVGDPCLSVVLLGASSCAERSFISEASVVS